MRAAVVRRRIGFLPVGFVTVHGFIDHLQLPEWMQNELHPCTLKTFDEEIDNVLAKWNGYQVS